ncbi:kinase-like domain-containing protein [Cladorrhinum sp. PSN332]|nr:kinase-like domain-containing protein [Cladorrhinum sp. PSN332]
METRRPTHCSFVTNASPPSPTAHFPRQISESTSNPIVASSPPPTPPSRSPNRAERRFEYITSPCEWVERYCPGGYHPVHLGDVFSNGQYEMLVSKFSESTTERQILDHIFEAAPTQAKSHITQLLGEFQHHGPNGIHRCLVFEPMGPAVNTMVQKLPQFNPPKAGMKFRYPLPMAKNILKQALQALAFLHQHGIAHGDFQPGSILFALEDISSMPQDELRQEENVKTGSISPQVQRRDGKQDPWVPRYLSITQPLLILAGTIDNTTYVWSFGCLVFELVTGEPLFTLGRSEWQDDEHLLDMHTSLGPLPDGLFRRWKTSSLYFTPERDLYNLEPGGAPKGLETLYEAESMEELFGTGVDLDKEEARKITGLIRRILQYDPAKRPSPAELLRDPWFSEEASSL